jgi:hypothetical protein
LFAAQREDWALEKIKGNHGLHPRCPKHKEEIGISSAIVSTLSIPLKLTLPL